MYRAVEKHCDDNAAIVGTVVAFGAALTDFKTKIASIISTEQLSALVITGIAEDKFVLKQDLCQKASDVASIIGAYASAISDNTMAEQVAFPFTKLLKTRDDQLGPLCQNILDIGNAHSGPLKDYGLSAANLTALQTAIGDYSASTPKPRTAMSQRKTYLSNLKDIFAATDTVLKKQMDKLIVNFKASNPDFVKEYKSNRVIIDPGTTTTQLRGTVTNKANNSLVAGATISIVEASKTVKSNATGKYSVKPVPPGTYTINASAAGFDPFTAIGVSAKLGVATTFNIELTIS